MNEDDWVYNDPRGGRPVEAEDPEVAGVRQARADGVIKRHSRERLLDSRRVEVGTAIAALLDEFDLTASSADEIDELSRAVYRLRAADPRPARALTSRERRQAIAAARALLRHIDKRPRRAETTSDKRELLVRSLDSLQVVVKLSATSGFNITNTLEKLRAGIYGADDLSALIIALDSVPAGENTCLPEANYRPVLRAGFLLWRACGRRASYTLDQYVDPPTLNGAFPDFLRRLLSLSQVRMPGDSTLHKHLRALKNV